MKTYYVILVNGVPEQVTTFWARAKQAVDELTTRDREARIVPCVECPASDFESEEPTERDIVVEP